MTKVIVLLSTYNGEKYLKEQIDSLLRQEGVEVKIIVRDDGSKDATKRILDEYQSKDLIRWYTGDNLRPAKSFFNLMDNASVADYYALCDQDDVWDKDKLAIAVKALEGHSNIPALYCGNTRLVDSNLNTLHVSNKWCTGKFAESLFHNPVTGCTCVFNKQLMSLYRHSAPGYVHMHDWWIYLLCTAFNGYIYFDMSPHISYRQHENNVIGDHVSTKELAESRWNVLIHPAEGTRYKQAKSLYDSYGHLMSASNLILLKKLLESRKNVVKAFKFAFSKELANLAKFSSNKYVWKMRTLILLRRF